MAEVVPMGDAGGQADEPLPPGNRPVLKLGERYLGLDDGELARLRERFARQWDSGGPLVLPPDTDLFVLTPDGRVSGRVSGTAAPPRRFEGEAGEARKYAFHNGCFPAGDIQPGKPAPEVKAVAEIKELWTFAGKLLETSVSRGDVPETARNALLHAKRRLAESKSAVCPHCGNPHRSPLDETRAVFGRVETESFVHYIMRVPGECPTCGQRSVAVISVMTVGGKVAEGFQGGLEVPRWVPETAVAKE